MIGWMKTCSRYSFNAHNNEISELLNIKAEVITHARAHKQAHRQEQQKLWFVITLKLCGNMFSWPVSDVTFVGMTGWQGWLALHILSVKPLLRIILLFSVSEYFLTVFDKLYPTFFSEGYYMLGNLYLQEQNDQDLEAIFLETYGTEESKTCC